MDFASLQISYMKRILEDSAARISTASDMSKDSLSGGIWYGIDYFSAAQMHKSSAFLQMGEGAGLHGYAPEAFFQPVADPESPTGRLLYSFRLKEGKSPTDAIERLLKGPSLLDCGNVCNLASYLALRDLFTNKQFDRLFDPMGPTPLILTADGTSTLSRFLSKTIIGNEREIRRGDICYFSNCQEYVAKHPAGEARGFHVIACSENPHRYLGFGLSPEGLSRNEVEQSLWNSFNEEPVDEGFYPPFVWRHLYTRSLLCNEQKSQELVRAFRNKTLTWDEYQKSASRLVKQGLPMDGKMGLWVYRFRKSGGIN